MDDAGLAFYREPAAMSAIPESIPGFSELPGDVDGLRGVVQVLLLHRDPETIRQRYLRDERLTVPPDITSYIDGHATPVHLGL